MIIFVLTLIIMCGISIFFLKDIGSITIEHNKTMEKHNIDHIRNLRNLIAKTSHLMPELKINVRFLVPHEKQTLWIKLFNNIKVQLYTFDYCLDNTDREQNSYYTIVISKKTYFHLKMKNWADTCNRELALKGLMHLDWKKELP